MASKGVWATMRSLRGIGEIFIGAFILGIYWQYIFPMVHQGNDIGAMFLESTIIFAVARGIAKFLMYTQGEAFSLRRKTIAEILIGGSITTITWQYILPNLPKIGFTFWTGSTEQIFIASFLIYVFAKYFAKVIVW